MENKEDALCWYAKEDGSVQFWCSMEGKEIEAFWFPSSNKVRLEWKLENGYSSVTESKEFELGQGILWRGRIVQALRQHLGIAE
jgi:hypothetical protein